MTRPILPPKYVNGSLAVLVACKDKRAMWFTYSVLRAFAWSEDTLIIDRTAKAVLKKTFNIPKSTLERHLDWLASPSIHAILRYGSAGGYTQIDFSPSANVDWDSFFNETVPNLGIAYSSSSRDKDHNNDSLGEEEHSPKNGTVPNMGQPNVSTVYRSNIGSLNPMIKSALKNAEQTYSAEWVIAAIEEAVKNNARSWKYCATINVVGGFLITDRMLRMFKRPGERQP